MFFVGLALGQISPCPSYLQPVGDGSVCASSDTSYICALWGNPGMAPCPSKCKDGWQPLGDGSACGNGALLVHFTRTPICNDVIAKMWGKCGNP
jgi:hypothetical protein